MMAFAEYTLIRNTVCLSSCILHSVLARVPCSRHSSKQHNLPDFLSSCVVALELNCHVLARPEVIDFLL